MKFTKVVLYRVECVQCGLSVIMSDTDSGTGLLIKDGWKTNSESGDLCPNCSGSPKSKYFVKLMNEANLGEPKRCGE